MKDGRWQPHRSCWVVAREIGGPCVDSEDAGQAVAAPPPVLGHCAKSGACVDVDARRAVGLLGPGLLLARSGGLAWTVRMQDRRWQPHRPCWVVARNRGLAMWTQDRRWQPHAHAGSWVVACEIKGLAWTGRTQDRRWQPHRPCWVVARHRGLAWMWTQGGGSRTARAGLLLAKPGACVDVATRQVVAAPPPMLGRCSRNRGAHMDMAAPSPTLGRCSRNRGARGADRGACAAFQLAGQVAGADTGPFVFWVGYGG